MAGALVSVVRLFSYEPREVDVALERLLEPLGGASVFAAPDGDVVLKPNFLLPRAASRAVCTHPEVIRAVARSAARATGREPLVTDSPGWGTATACARRLGLGADEPFRVVDADDGVEIAPPGAPFHGLHLSRRMVEAACLVNLPKFKTHGQLLLTAAAKNTFGAVVGLEKAQWHYRAGRDPQAFARLIVHIHELLAPRISILDAVIGMEGNGPGSGSPRSFGALLASASAHALDAVLCRALGIDPLLLPTFAAARETGRVCSPDAIAIAGVDPAALRPQPAWRMARPLPLPRVGPGALLQPLVQRLFKLRPEVQRAACVGCGRCAEVCAAGAISLDASASPAAAGLPRIDRGRCISCFCCQEICPAGAIRVSAGPLARMLGLRPGR